MSREEFAEDCLEAKYLDLFKSFKKSTDNDEDDLYYGDGGREVEEQGNGDENFVLEDVFCDEDDEEDYS